MTTPAFAGVLALGHLLRMTDRNGTLRLALQNFYWTQTLEVDDIRYTFSPFGFSGLTSSKQGDLEPASLIFPNTEVSRGFADEALRGRNIVSWPANNDDSQVYFPYIITVDVMLMDPNESENVKRKSDRLYRYTGQASSANWDDTNLNLEIGSILDAVRPDLPTRTLRRDLVGNLPITGSVRVR